MKNQKRATAVATIARTRPAPITAFLDRWSVHADCSRTDGARRLIEVSVAPAVSSNNTAFGDLPRQRRVLPRRTATTGAGRWSARARSSVGASGSSRNGARRCSACCGGSSSRGHRTTLVLHAERRVGDEIDPRPVGKDEAAIHEAGFGRVADRRISAVIEMKEVELAVDGVGD
jgi:hypothetical protein